VKSDTIAQAPASPDEDIEAVKRVTLADVNRVAKDFLVDENSITATLKPVPTRVGGWWAGGAQGSL
jgi:predicted Zn-dependent peptidase